MVVSGAPVLLVLLVAPQVLSDVASMVGLPPDKFGNMKPSITSMSTCAGPKRASCADLSIQHSDDYSNITFTMVVKKNVQIHKIKVAIYASASAAPDVLRWVERPCDNFFFSAVFSKFFRTGANCLVMKGTYVMNANTTAMFYDFMGGSFFYGRYRSHAVVLARDCNLACTWAHFSIERKDKTKD